MAPGSRVVAVVAAVVVAEIVGIGIHVVLIGVLLAIDRGLIEQPAPRRIVGAPDIINAGVARERAARLITPGAAAGALVDDGGIAEALARTAHHRADSVHQQRTADHAGCSRRRCAEERATAAERRAALSESTLSISALAISLALAVGTLIIVAATLGLLQHLARVPDRAARRRWRNIRHRAVLFLAKDRVAHGIEEAAGLGL